jgi:hypothetical protein
MVSSYVCASTLLEKEGFGTQSEKVASEAVFEFDMPVAALVVGTIR